MQAQDHDANGLKYVILKPEGYRDGKSYPLVILMHGYGSHMRDLAQLAPAIDPDGYLYAFPNGPVPIDLGYGARGYAWAHPDEDDEAEAEVRSGEMLDAFFGEVIGKYGVAPGQVVLGGFSQGGVMALRNGLPNPDTFCGVVSLSGRLPNPDALRSRLPRQRDQSTFIAHGTMDTMLEVELGRSARRFLEAEGYSPEYHEYEMGHQITPDVLADLALWLRTVLPPAAP